MPKLGAVSRHLCRRSGMLMLLAHIWRSFKPQSMGIAYHCQHARKKLDTAKGILNFASARSSEANGKASSIGYFVGFKQFTAMS